MQTHAHQPLATSDKRSSTHGGRRPGAGAPRGNLNGYKHGGRSKQVKAMQAALDAVPMTAHLLAGITGRDPARLELLARSLHYYADLLLLATNQQAIKNIHHLQLQPGDFFARLIKQSSRAAKRQAAPASDER